MKIFVKHKSFLNTSITVIIMICSYGVIACVDDKVLMVKRRDSYAFIDFFSGRSVNVKGMSKEEHARLMDYDFDALFADVFLNKQVAEKFVTKCKTFYNKHIDEVKKQISKETGCEFGLWEFPKGRNEKGESERETAIREFKEETGIRTNMKLSRKRIKEVFLGDNGKQYCNFYYACKLPEELEIKYRLLKVGIRRKTVSNETIDADWIDIETAKKRMTPKRRRILDLLKNLE